MRRLSYFHLDFFSFAEAHSGFQSDLEEDQKTVCSQVQDLETDTTRAPIGSIALPTGSSLSCHIGRFPGGTLKRVKTAHNKMAC